MTGDTTPQQQAVEALVEHFQPDAKGCISLYPAKSSRDYSAATSTGDGPMDFRILSFGEIVDCLADAGLLCSSPVQPKEDEGSLRSVPSAPGPQWAVLREDDDVLYETEASARRVLSFLSEDGEGGHRLYEVREVSRD